MTHPAATLARTLGGRRQALYLGRRDDGPVFAGQEDHLLVLGPSRTGKTSGLIVPSVAVHPGPAVVVSTRTDIIAPVCSARLALAEYDGGSCSELALGTMSEHLPSVSWSATTGCADWNTALDRASVIVNTATAVTQDSFWPAAAIDLLSCCLFGAGLLGHDDRTMAAIIDSADVNQYYAAVYEVCGESHAVTNKFGRFFNEDAMAEDTRKSIFATLSGGPLGSFRYDEGGSHSDFDPTTFVESSGTLFVTIPWHQREMFQPRVTALVEAIVDAWRNRDRSDGWTLLLALDEVANVAPLPNLPQLVTAGAGDGIQLLLGMQAPDQAERWGKQASVVLGDPSHLALFPGLKDSNYLETVSTLIGEEIRYDLEIHVVSDPPNGHAFADHGRLIHERGELDGAREAVPARQRTRAALSAASIIARKRAGDGIRTRGDAAGPKSVLAEIEKYTTVKRVPKRLPRLSVSDLTDGRDDHFFLRTRGDAGFQRFLPWFRDPFWLAMLQFAGADADR
jgi:type IV secretion system protein VirD4